MKFEQPTLTGVIQNRYKRFFADITLDDGTGITAHVPNTGSMKTCWAPGWRVLVTYHNDPKRKLPYTLEMAHNTKSWIGVNTSRPNKLAARAIGDGTIGELGGYRTLKSECKVGLSRIDLLLDQGPPKRSPCYVEVKNVTLAENEQALFPDAVTVRGQKHLRELMAIKAKGIRAVMLFVVQREDVQNFSCAESIDPTYGQLLGKAQALGVEILAYGCRLSQEGISIQKPLPVTL